MEITVTNPESHLCLKMTDNQYICIPSWTDKEGHNILSLYKNSAEEKLDILSLYKNKQYQNYPSTPTYFPFKLLARIFLLLFIFQLETKFGTQCMA